MRKHRLLDRQARVLEYLTSSIAIFGPRDSAAIDPLLDGIDPGLLRLEARFSYSKRMEKITAVFPKTFEILADNQRDIVEAFVAACPPADIGRLANAHQFHDFLRARWRREPPQPRHLRDVAACELACAEVGAVGDDREERAEDGQTKPRCGIRRSRAVILLRCAYDVRPIFENGSYKEPVARETLLTFAKPAGAGDARVFEVSSAIFDLLRALDHWTDPAAFGDTPEAKSLVTELVRRGLIEVGK